MEEVNFMANSKIPSKKLNSDEVSVLLSISSESITLDKLKELFAYRANDEPLYNTSDWFFLPEGILYSNNLNSNKTTAGRYIFNKLILTSKIGPLIGYQNYTMDSDGIGKLDGQMSELLRDDKITTKDFFDYLDKMQWLGFSTSRFLNASLTTELMIPPKKIQMKKKELIEKNKDKIKNLDIDTINSIQDELLDDAKKEIRNEPSMEIYESGARGSYKNNYKNLNIFRGLVPSMEDPTKFNVSTASLYDGIPPEEQDIYANIATLGSSSRAIATQNGGLTKNKVFQLTI